MEFGDGTDRDAGGHRHRNSGEQRVLPSPQGGWQDRRGTNLCLIFCTSVQASGRLRVSFEDDTPTPAGLSRPHISPTMCGLESVFSLSDLEHHASTKKVTMATPLPVSTQQRALTAVSTQQVCVPSSTQQRLWTVPVPLWTQQISVSKRDTTEEAAKLTGVYVVHYPSAVAPDAPVMPMPIHQQVLNGKAPAQRTVEPEASAPDVAPPPQMRLRTPVMVSVSGLSCRPCRRNLGTYCNCCRPLAIRCAP